MKVLQLYHKVPFPPHDGGGCSLYAASLGLLSAGVSLRILAMNPSRTPMVSESIPEGFARETRFETVDVDNRVTPVGCCRALLSHSSLFASRFYSDDFGERLRELLLRERFDIIQLEHLYLCLYLDVIRKHSGAKVVLRAQNVEHRVWDGYCSHLKNPLMKGFLEMESVKLKLFERQKASSADGIIALSKEDTAWFRQVCRADKVISIPPALLNPPDPAIIPWETNGNPPVAFHLGSMDWRPNIQGMKWFVREVLPLVRAMKPDLKIHLAGREMPEWFYRRQSEGLHVEGEVEDASRFVSDKQILIVPLLSGSGIRVKILEAMSHGKVVISTTTGASGIGAMPEKEILLADTPETFARQLCRCAGNPALCQSISEGARRFSGKGFSISSTGEQMVGFYGTILAQRRGTHHGRTT